MRGPWRLGAAGRRLAVASLAGALVAGIAGVAWAGRHDLVLVSRVDGAAGAPANGSSREASLSAGGRYVAFSSDAENLSDADRDTHKRGYAITDVFVRDVLTGTTTLVSRGPNGAAGDEGSESPSISGDGRHVAFESSAPNFGDYEGFDALAVYVRDLDAGTTSLISRASGADGVAGNDAAFLPSISRTGRYVAFESYATNLSRADRRYSDVFVRDTGTGRTILASRADGRAGTAANSGSFTPSISGNGRFVAFKSFANNLSRIDDNSVSNIFVRDLRRKITTLVSRVATEGADADSYEPSISADGRYVVFHSRADNLSAVDDDSLINVFVRDLRGKTTTLVSRVSGRVGPAANGGSSSAAISDSGRYVAFESRADNLSDEARRKVNLYVRDLRSHTTTYVNRAAGEDGEPGRGGAFDPTLSADGRFVAFESGANNLSGEDDDEHRNVFIRDLLGPSGAPEPRIQPGLRTEIRAARQRGDRIAIEVVARLVRTGGRPCKGRIAVGATTGARNQRRVLPLAGSCARPVTFRFPVRKLKRRVRPRNRRLMARVKASYKGSRQLEAVRAGTLRRKVRR